MNKKIMKLFLLNVVLLGGCTLSNPKETNSTENDSYKITETETDTIEIEAFDSIQISKLSKNSLLIQKQDIRETFIHKASIDGKTLVVFATPIDITKKIGSIVLTRTLCSTNQKVEKQITDVYRSFEGHNHVVYYYDSVNNCLTSDESKASSTFYMIVYTIEIQTRFNEDIMIEHKVNNTISSPWIMHKLGTDPLYKVNYVENNEIIGINRTSDYAYKPVSNDKVIHWMNENQKWNFENGVTSDLTLVSKVIPAEKPMLYNCVDIHDSSYAFCRENFNGSGRNVYNPEMSNLPLNASNRMGLLLNKDYPLIGSFEVTVEFGLSAWDQGYIGAFPYYTEYKGGIILKQASTSSEFVNQTDSSKMLGLFYNNKDNKTCEYVNGSFTNNHDFTDSTSLFDLFRTLDQVSNPNESIPMLKVKITRDSSNNLKAVWYKKLANDLDYSLLTDYVFETNFSGSLIMGLTQYNVYNQDQNNQIYFVNPSVAGIEHTTKMEKYSFADPGVYQENGEVFLTPTATYAFNNYRVSNPIYKTKDFVNGNYVGSFGGDGYTEVAHSANGKWGTNFTGCSVWGPQIIKKDGIYYSFYTMGGGARGSALGYATASSLDGIWTDQGPMLYNSHNKGDTVGLVPNGTVTNCKSHDYNGDLIDSYIVEENGQYYMFYGSFAGIYRRTLTFNGTTVTVGDTATLVVGNTTYNLNQIEGTAVRKINGYWYLFGSSGRMGSDDEKPSSITNPYHVVAYKGGTSITDSFSSESTEVVSSRTTGSDRIYAVGGCDFAEINGELYMVYHGRSLNAFNSGIKYRTLLVDKIICDSNGPHVEGRVPQGVTGF